MDKYLVVNTDNFYNSEILSVKDTHEQAIDFLTSHMDDQYEPQKGKYKISQKNKETFEIFQVGYLYKSFHCKLQIVNINIS
jgi:hypothetical protein